MKLTKAIVILSTLFISGALSLAQGHAKAHYITAKKAEAAALKKYHGKVIGKVLLENEDGKMQYSVNIRSGKTLREVMVDARTGKIASVETTTKAEEAKEAASEAKPKVKKR